MARPDIGGPSGVEGRKCPGRGERKESAANMLEEKRENVLHDSPEKNSRTKLLGQITGCLSISIASLGKLLQGGNCKGFSLKTKTQCSLNSYRANKIS